MQRLGLVLVLAGIGVVQAQPNASSVETTQLESNNQLQQEWGLSSSEAARYSSALVRMAPFLDIEQISPLEVLGMSAESEQEKRALARRHVEAMLAHQVRAIEWSLYVEEAARAINPGSVIERMPIVTKALESESTRLKGRKADYFSRPSSNYSRTSSGELFAKAAIDSRLVLFVEPNCAPCDQAFDDAREHLESGLLPGLDVVFAGMNTADKSTITEWAIRRGVKPEAVSQRLITLNYENEAWKALRADREVPVSIRAGAS